MPTLGPFDFQIGISGAKTEVNGRSLHPDCMSDDEVDYHIADLKSELDRLAIEMKKAITKQRKQSLFGKDKTQRTKARTETR